MNLRDADVAVRKMDGIWVLRSAGESREEWLEFLLPLDAAAALETIRNLRAVSKYRPAMSEFLEEYRIVAARRDAATNEIGGRRFLNGQCDHTAEGRNLELYGSEQGAWVYCFKCDMVVSLEERATSARYREDHGMCHAKCPPRGSRPSIPNGKRLERDEYWRKVGIAPSETRRGAA